MIRQPGSGSAELGRRGDPVEAGHLDVEERDIRSRRDGRRHDLVAARDLADDLDVALQGKQRGEGAAYHRLVLGQQDADHVARGCVVGRTAVMARARRDPRQP